MGWLRDVELEHLPRKDNKQADTLAKLASTLSMTNKEAHILIYKSWVIPPIFSDDEDDTFQEEENHVTKVFEVEEEHWLQPLVDYLKYGKLPMIYDRGLTPADYFSKWAEAVPLKQVRRRMSDFIRTHIIYRYGVPRTLCNLRKKVVAKSKRDLHERIGEALWAYRITIRTPTQATPYALVYGVETVLPLEQQIRSLRIAIQEGLTEE
ncbi:UNVERIFIED_CONTAM: hypothetical protein Sangu_2992600 [Sesamum angustifolium]|uniref:RNase H type-1 domain-containing protein n=1 Tax=Sesamum angustifolium TaxID=2727405 RepID=A0AAW2KQ43_9LAMI